MLFSIFFFDDYFWGEPTEPHFIIEHALEGAMGFCTRWEYRQTSSINGKGIAVEGFPRLIRPPASGVVGPGSRRAGATRPSHRAQTGVALDDAFGDGVTRQA